MSLLNMDQPWCDLPIVVIDTETTGVGEGHAAIEVAAVRFERGAIVSEYATLLNPQRPIDPGATDVHGITDEMVAGAPTLAEVAPKLFKVCAGAAPCAYNAPFDKAMLHSEIAGADCPAFDPAVSWIDVYVVIASERVDKYVKGKGRLKLGAACDRHGVDHRSAHRALGDARATGKLLWRLFEKGLIKPVSLGLLLKHTDRMREKQTADFQDWLSRQPKREGELA